MENKIRIWKAAILAGALFFLSAKAGAEELPSGTVHNDQTTASASGAKPDSIVYRDNFRNDDYLRGYKAGYRAGFQDGQQRRNFRPARRYANGTIVRSLDTTTSERRFMHRLSAEFRPEHIFPTNPFVEGENQAGQPIDLSLSGHLRYSFQFRPGSLPDQIYGGAYQGIGAAYYDFGNPDELGSPIAVYLFQGARIARISPRLSFNYEWNFGLSFGWKPYDDIENSFNKMMGSKMNAYLNADFFFDWRVTREVDFTAGLSLTHFSNGNTKFPNAGLRMRGAISADFRPKL